MGETLRDGRPVPEDGVWLEHTDPIQICSSGLHGSEEPFDALQYSPGETLCLCEFDGIMEKQSDKFVAAKRKIIVRMDAVELLRHFARMQALSVVHLWDAPDVVLDYLMTGDESLRYAARNAARNAALDAARNAALDAARNAARYAARNAALDALDAARYARDAAQDAARYARDAAQDAARKEFNNLVYESFEEWL